MGSINQTFLIDPHVEDFHLFSKYVEEKPSSTLYNVKKDKIKGIYKKMYYYNLMLNNIYDLLDEDNKFIRESLGDLIMAMELFNMNYLKPSKMSLRSSIEQFNRFLLQKESQFEMGLSVRDINRKVKVLYHNSTIKFFISTLLSDYRNLCKFVHVEENNNFSQNLVLSSYKDFDNKKIDILNKELQRVTEVFCSLLIILDNDKYMKIPKYNRLLIECILTKTNLDRTFQALT